METIQIGDIIWNTVAEGPGTRIALWVQGCSLRCPGCCNPHLLSRIGGTSWQIEELAKKIAATDHDGLTILGGEPLDQAEGLYRLLLAYRMELTMKSVWLFTGYEWEAIAKIGWGNDVTQLCDVVIAGPFDQTRIDFQRKWIGSTNQTIHEVSERGRQEVAGWPMKEFDLELVVGSDEISLNGWPLHLTNLTPQLGGIRKE